VLHPVLLLFDIGSPRRSLWALKPSKQKPENGGYYHHSKFHDSISAMLPECCLHRFAGQDLQLEMHFNGARLQLSKSFKLDTFLFFDNILLPYSDELKIYKEHVISINLFTVAA